ncbi:MAG: SusC/RagA family TonB-linked outer membrane protein, partial [Paludibacter sp. SCN 50-10]
MRKTIVLTLLSCFSWLSYAQTPAEVKGIVQDATTGEPLIGVNILVEGTQAGSVTGLDGDFTISAPPKSTIRVSYIGYKVQMIQLKGESFLTIRLEPDTKLIDEVVVVGYTVQKKRDVLGAISKVESAEIGKIPVATSQQALQGRIAGVNVAAQTGAPGAPVSVRIRGVNSISLSNDPLYIVDGIPVEGALNNISPNEIESMTVLKDASSAAIYGSRATNGVVLITTKNGKSGDSKISYNMQLGFQEHGKLTKMATTEQYISMYNEAASADNATSVVKRALIEGSWVKDFPNVNHLEEIFRTAPFQSHELSVSGGNETTQFLISGIHFIQDGIINTTNFTRTNLRSNISSQLKKWLKTGLNISGGISNNRLVSSSGDGFAGEGGSVVRYALFRNPAIPVYSNTGEFIDLPSEYYGNSVYNSFFGDGYNPVGLTENTDRTKKIKTLMASGNVLISLPADLTLKTTAGIDYNNTLFREYNKTWGSANRINGTNGLSVSSVENLNWSINSTLNHSITLGEVHNLTTMAGAEAIKNSGYGMYGSESEFLNTDPGFLYLGLGSSKTRVTQSVWESTLVSFFANTSYNFNQKYYLSGILRHDGSSRFSKGNQWGTFYSVSGGWNVETEEFMKEIPAIYKLKLRAGYGSIGNQNIPLYSYTDRYGYNFYYTFGGQSYNGYAQTQLGNDKLKWETSNQFNVGADVELLKGELGLTLDYYYKITNDMLLPASLPPSIGNAAPFQINSDGNILNTGIDVEIFYRKNFRDGGFNISLNGGYLKNKVLKLDNPYFAGRVDTGVFATRTEQGYPIGSFFLYEMAGIFQNDLDVLTSAYQGNNIKPGDVKYVDQNEDNIIDARDRTFLGSAIPKITTGLTLSGNYKNFDLSMFFQGAFGQKIFSQVNYDIEGFYRGFNVTERYYREHWTGEGSSNTQP